MTERNTQGVSMDRSKRQILVAEADSAVRCALMAAMSDRYVIAAATTRDEALDIIYKNKDLLELVLLNLSLSDQSGMDILRQMAEDPLLMRIPVIAMSADRSLEVASLEAGAMDFILLPCPQIEIVLTRVSRTIELSENRNIVRSTERDPLTGLYNKDFFFSYVRQYDLYHGALDMDAIIVNISHFHMINERYGRAYGDQALRTIGARLREYLAQDGGIICRRDGDVFMVYCPHREDYEDILNFASHGMDSRIRLRMGVYPNVDKSLDIERRFDRAKLASDTVRDTFTRRVGMYDDKLRKSEIYTEQLLEDFPAAIAEKQFVIYYQPKFAIQATMPVLNSSEALVRWVHPKLGMINPGDFIPLFEKNGLIRELDGYVWREVAAQMRDWKDRLNFCLPVSVNVSRVDMFDQDLVEHMQNLVAEFDLSPDEFLLEITESAYTQDSDQIINTVTKLREAGFHIEIDDFGSGYSSLNMISTLPMDALKLDMEFMHNAFKERKNTKMLDAVIDIAYSLEVPTIAEGVETAEQMFALKEMGCDIVQGYYFSRPVPAAEYERFLLERRDGRRGWLVDKDKVSVVKPAEQFAYEALHDPQTGLYNHSAYKMLLKDADQRNIALLLADLKDYDSLIAEHGEDVAGRVVELVAEVLRHNFRSVDFVCRISNDEFAIIMTRVNNSMKSLVADKVQRIDAMLAAQRHELPPVSLAIGVAFADRENPQGDIFHDADLALEDSKRADGNGWSIY